MLAGMRVTSLTPVINSKTRSIKVKLLLKTDMLSTKLMKSIADPGNDQLAMFRYNLKPLTLFTSIPNIALNVAKFFSALVLFNIRTCSAMILTLDL